LALGAMALLVLLARSARARVVAADAVLVGDHARLDARYCLDLLLDRQVGGALGGCARRDDARRCGCRRCGERARLVGLGPAGVAEAAWLLRTGAPGLSTGGVVGALD